MATFYPSITDEQADLIRNAPLFFVASVEPALGHGPDGQGPVNVSPKGGVPLHILDKNRVAFLDCVGSGNETARHSSLGGPITVMIGSYDAENAAIVRLYGHATVTPLDESPIADLLLGSQADDIALPQRQAIEITIDQTVTSCGYGVPVMDFVKDRTTSERGRKYKDGTPPTGQNPLSSSCQPTSKITG